MLRRKALQILEEKIAGCTQCSELSEYRCANEYKTVPGTGDSEARILVLGEAPGENEAKEGNPFVGKAGKLLTNILLGMGLTREEVFITNILKCRPPKNRKPETEEAKNCRKFLDLQIKAIDPEWIICFGQTASTHLLGKNPDTTTMAELREQVFEYDGRKVVCTYHPSYLVRHGNESKERKELDRKVCADLMPVVSALHVERANV